MKRLPDRPDLGHLKKQAKDLLGLYRSGDPAAVARLRAFLPAAAGKRDLGIAARDLRLHDAQSCIAREYGFASWADLKSYVEARTARLADKETALRRLLSLIYAGDIAGGTYVARPGVAARILEDNPTLPGHDPYIACALGDEEALRRETQRNPGWVNQAGGPLALPPLVAVTHSSLLRLAEFREGLLACARHLLEAGADPDQSVPSRWAGSLAAPSEEFPLSALYGAAGQNRDPEMTQLLLNAGANPNDGESLYHSLESPPCTRLLLEAGARTEGTNAIYRALDLDDVAPLRLVLAHGADPNEPASSAPTSDWGTPLLWAIRRRQSLAHIEALLDAGADPTARTPRGESADRVALKFGLPAQADLVRQRAGQGSALTPQDAFIAACTRGDESAARRLLSASPNLLAAMPEADLALLPELAAQGADEAVRVMVTLGWPVAVRGGDWQGSALNQAVFRGDPALTRFLLEHGAAWTETHGFGDNVVGTLSWASLNEPVAGGDWPGCAEALLAHGLPPAEPDPEGSDAVLVAGVRRLFSDAVTDVLITANRSSEARVAR